MLSFAEPRQHVPLLDPGFDRDPDAEPVALCGWCGRAEYGPLWLDIEALLRAGRLLERAAMPPVSYGICAGCRHEMSAGLQVLGHSGDSTV